MVPLMQHEVESRAWLPPGRFLDVLAISEATPGPVAVNLATFAGYQVAGFPGAAAATVGVCLPGAMLLFLLGAFAAPLRHAPAFRSAMRSLLPMLVGLLAATALRMATSVAHDSGPLPPPAAAILFAAALAVVLRGRIHPLPLLAAASAIGIVAAAF